MLFLFRFPAKQLYYYITAFLICQVLFSSFFKLFFQLLVTALLSCNFYIISHCLNFVKYFFQKLFSKVLSIPLKSPGSVKRLSLRSDLPRSLSLATQLSVPDSFFIISRFLRFVKEIISQIFSSFLYTLHKCK